MPIQSAFVLTPNMIFGSLANMILRQEVSTNNVNNHQTLVEKARKDVGLFGDRYLRYATDGLPVYDFLGDAEAGNLLALDRPGDPKVQAWVIDTMKQIRLTTDSYASKQAWSDEGSFQAFQSVMLSWMGEAKKMYEGSSYNVNVGTAVVDAQVKELVFDDVYPENEGIAIAQFMADLYVEMGDYSREFNEYGFMRSFNQGQIKVLWNSKFVNKVLKTQLPVIFHEQGLIDKINEDVMPSKYFGKILGAGTVPAGNKKIRAAKAKFYGDTYLLAGALLPAGTAYAAGDAYEEDPEIICKVYVDLPPYLDAFSTTSSFYNARSLTTNNYITYAHSDFATIKDLPWVTVKGKHN